MQHKKRMDLPDLNAEQRRVLTVIYEIYYPQMYKKAYGILRNKQDAEDAVQEAFYRVCLHADVFMQPDSDSTAALIHTFTKNVAINYYHRKKRRNALLMETEKADPESIPEEYDLAILIEKQESAKDVRRAVDALEPVYREVIVLKYYEHKTNSEIAAQLGVTRNIVNGRIFRAKKKLRKYLEQQNT